MDQALNIPIDPLLGAKSVLQAELAIVETNAPIHEAEGREDQAALARANAASYKLALEKLEA